MVGGGVLSTLELLVGTDVGPFLGVWFSWASCNSFLILTPGGRPIGAPLMTLAFVGVGLETVEAGDGGIFGGMLATEVVTTGFCMVVVSFSGV